MNQSRLFDTHAHLDFRQFDSDRADAIRRAEAEGLLGIVNVATDLASSQASIRLAERYDFIWSTVGVHPHSARTVGDREIAALRDLANHPKVVAIGEIGLDYYRDLSPRRDQRGAFEAQLELAAELAKPVVVHSRDAHEDVHALLDSFGGAVILHSYSAGPCPVPKLAAKGYFISIAGPVTFRNADPLRKAAALVPLDCLLVETDCPFLTPEPHRGRRNEPAYVRYVIAGVARARGCAPEAIAQATVANACRVFGIS